MKRLGILVVAIATCVVVAVAIHMQSSSTENAARLNFTYTMQEYQSSTADTCQNMVFCRLADALLGQDRTRNIVEVFVALTASVPVFVWGLQQRNLRSSSWGIEVYFYYASDHTIHRILSILAAYYDVRLSYLPFLGFSPGMVSFELPTERGGVIDAADIYDIVSPTYGYCIRYDATHAQPMLKNKYYFSLREYDQNTVASKRAAKRSTDDARPKEFPVVIDDWRISRCIANKSDGRRGIYYSGVPARVVERTRAAPLLVQRTLKSMLLRHSLLDIGYDTIDGKQVSFCVYGAYRQEQTSRNGQRSGIM